MRILFVHGRAQGGRDPEALCRIWVDTLKEGLAAAGKSLPTAIRVDFPFYGDKLDEFTRAADLPTAAEVAAKGPGQDRDYEQFMQSALTEIYERSALTEADVVAAADGADVTEKGPANWGWVQAIARAIDRLTPRATDFTINRFLRDVYLYVNKPAVTSAINAIVEEKLTNEPTVVVGHSLGSVVAYRVIIDNLATMQLRRYVTVGSPLGLRAISTRLGVPENPGRDGWYNGYDERDVVALNPLNSKFFPADPEIENNSGIRNASDNHHGIVGYLNDPDVAAAIVDSLAADP